MTTQHTTGGPAFPVSLTETGMTLRDYFAAQYVAAMVSTIRCNDDYDRVMKVAEYYGMERVSDLFAHDAYEQADAMLRARETTP